jgi:hypothetical protein
MTPSGAPYECRFRSGLWLLNHPTEAVLEVLETRSANPVGSVLGGIASELRAGIVREDVVTEMTPTELTMIVIPISARVGRP